MLCCIDSGFCCISLNNVGIFLLVGHWLNYLLDISSDVSSVFNFIHQSSLRLPYVYMVQKSARHLDSVYTQNLGLPCFDSILKVSLHFPAAMHDLKSVLLFCKPGRRGVSHWSFSYIQCWLQAALSMKAVKWSSPSFKFYFPPESLFCSLFRV